MLQSSSRASPADTRVAFCKETGPETSKRWGLSRSMVIPPRNATVCGIGPSDSQVYSPA